GGDFRIENWNGNPGDFLSFYDPIIRSRGDVSFTNYIGSSLHILAGGSVNIDGAVIITRPETGTPGTDFIAENITLSDGTTVVNIDGSAEPTLDVRAGVNPNIVGSPGVTGESPPTSIFGVILFNPGNNDLFFRQRSPTTNNTNNTNRADINIGSVAFVNLNLQNLLTGTPISANDLLAGKVLLTNRYEANQNLNGGNITVKPTLGEETLEALEATLRIRFPDNLNFPEESLAIITGSSERGGSIYMDSRGDITLNGIVGVPAIPANNTFSGNGGDVTLFANGNITLEPGSVIASVGNLGGKLTFNSGDTFSMKDAAVFNLTAGGIEGQKGGELSVNATNKVELVNTGSVSPVTNLVNLLRGIPGLDSQELLDQIENRDGTQLRNGNVEVNATEVVIDGNTVVATDDVERLIPGGIFTNASVSSATAEPGDVTITTQNLTIQNGERIVTSTSTETGTAANPATTNTVTGNNSPLPAQASEPDGTPVVPAQGWVFKDNGEVVLTAP
ncbi:MAG: hypothetical protein QNJ63_28430, partial [Calothrix sp. MO_192.B10]|nr:hypothetical protein [Calothrix sp. MO_192.B10]